MSNLDILKNCKKHGALSKDEVYLRGANKTWYRCKYCQKEYNKKTLNKYPKPVREAHKKNYYIKSTGLKVSKKWYEKQLSKQNNLCAICKKPEQHNTSPSSKKTKRLAIDHCHTTLQVRELLCHRCNTALGSMADSIEILQSAIRYLKKHQ